jgi:hypothetical protein
MTERTQPVSSEDLNLREESLYETVQRYSQYLKTFDAIGRVAARGIDGLASISRLR